MTMSKLQRLQSQHLALGEIIRKVDEEVIKRAPAPGKWSIKENAAHIAAYQKLFTERMCRILAGEKLTFQPYVPDEDIDFAALRNYSMPDLLSEFVSGRENLISLLDKLTPSQNALTAVHGKYGRMNIPEWTEFFLLHEAHHLFTIFKITRGL